MKTRLRATDHGFRNRYLTNLAGTDYNDDTKDAVTMTQHHQNRKYADCSAGSQRVIAEVLSDIENNLAEPFRACSRRSSAARRIRIIREKRSPRFWLIPFARKSLPLCGSVYIVKTDFIDKQRLLCHKTQEPFAPLRKDAVVLPDGSSIRGEAFMLRCRAAKRSDT